MPLNPHTDEVAARAWADQLRTEVLDIGWNIFENALHDQGGCSTELNEETVLALHSAILSGSVAMGTVLNQRDRFRDIEEPPLASAFRKLLLSPGASSSTDPQGRVFYVDGDVELTRDEIAAIEEVYDA